MLVTGVEKVPLKVLKTLARHISIVAPFRGLYYERTAFCMHAAETHSHISTVYTLKPIKRKAAAEQKLTDRVCAKDFRSL